MSHTSREPSTKFFGPNYPFVEAAAPNHWIVQLHNLKPGDAWDPLWAIELESPIVLDPLGTPAIWLWNGVYFWATLRYNIYDRLLIVRELATRTYAFLLNIHFAQQRWAMNELIVPTNNFAYDGSAEIIFRKE